MMAAESKSRWLGTLGKIAGSGPEMACSTAKGLRRCASWGRAYRGDQQRVMARCEGRGRSGAKAVMPHACWG